MQHIRIRSRCPKMSMGPRESSIKMRTHMMCDNFSLSGLVDDPRFLYAHIHTCFLLCESRNKQGSSCSGFLLVLLPACRGHSCRLFGTGEEQASMPQPTRKLAQTRPKSSRFKKLLLHVYKTFKSHYLTW